MSGTSEGFQCLLTANAQQLGITGVPTVANIIKALDMSYTDFVSMQWTGSIAYFGDSSFAVLDPSPIWPNTNLVWCYWFENLNISGWKNFLCFRILLLSLVVSSIVNPITFLIRKFLFKYIGTPK